jgi:hypothetical protein
MRKNSSALVCLVVSLIVSGCKVQPEAVYVDLSKVDSTITPAPQPSLPQPPAGKTPESVTLNELPSDSVLLDSRLELRRARTLIEDDRRRARHSLVQQYTIQRNADIDDQSEKMMQELKPLADKIRADVAKEIRARFDVYAAARGPLVAKLSSLEASVTRDRTSKPYQQNAAAQAQVSSEIAQLDATYLVDRKKIQSKVGVGVDDELTRIQTEVAGLRSEAKEEAAVSADKQLSDVHTNLPAPKAMRVQLEPIGARSLTVPGTSAAPKAPAVAAPASVDRQQLLSQQVEIWAKTNGYRLVKGRSDGRDATNEFLEWIKERKLGR